MVFQKQFEALAMHMDIYDFDGTLYQGDSTADFLHWCVRKYPRVVRTLPRTAVAALMCLGLKRTDKTQFKAILYRFLPLVPNVAEEVECFWQHSEHKITGPCTPRAGDLVISASPEFLLRDVCNRRGLALIASQVDPLTGAVLGPNCSGQQKVERLRAQFPDVQVDAFYSDSHNDDPLAALAQRAYLVRAGTLHPWPASHAQ